MTRIPKMSIFPSVRRPADQVLISIRRLYENIRGGHWAALVDPVHAIYQAEGKSDRYDAAKVGLPGFTAAGQFSYRNIGGLAKHTGMLIQDFDGLMSIAEAAALRDRLAEIPSCILSFISPSGAGVKAIFRVAFSGGETITADNHKQLWQAVAEMCTELTGIDYDPQNCDVARFCFVGHDPSARYQPTAEPLMVSLQVEPEQHATDQAGSPWAPPGSIQRTRTQRPTGTESVRNPAHYADAALEDAARVVASTPKGGRHHELLAAAAAIGGFCGAIVDGVALPLLERQEVQSVLAMAGIRAGLPRAEAWKTARDGVRFGAANPRTLSTAQQASCADWGGQSAEKRHTPPSYVCASSTLNRDWINPKGREAKDFRAYFRNVLRRQGAEKTHRCGGVGFMTKAGRGKFVRHWCGSANCRNCGAQKRAEWAAHIINMFRCSLYVTSISGKWDTRRFHDGIVWVWAQGEHARMVMSNAPVNADSRKVTGDKELEVLAILGRLLTNPARKQKLFGASLGAGLTSGQPPKGDSSWEYHGRCYEMRSVGEALALAVAQGFKVMSKQHARSHASCTAPDQVPLGKAEISLEAADLDVLLLKLGCKPRSEAA